jgi:hypothetical protein
MCEACKKGDHQECDTANCDCTELKQERVLRAMLRRAETQDCGLAETVYSNILYGGSAVAREITDAVGPSATRLFVQQILRTYKAVNG